MQSRPLHLPAASSAWGLRLTGQTLAVIALMLLAPLGFGADISFNTFTADSSVAGAEMINQTGGWFNAIIRFVGNYGFLFVIIIGAMVSLWGFTIGNNKAVGITGIVAALLGALYKALISYV